MHVRHWQGMDERFVAAIALENGRERDQWGWEEVSVDREVSFMRWKKNKVKIGSYTPCTRDPFIKRRPLDIVPKIKNYCIRTASVKLRTFLFKDRKIKPFYNFWLRKYILVSCPDTLNGLQNKNILVFVFISFCSFFQFW